MMCGGVRKMCRRLGGEKNNECGDVGRVMRRGAGSAGCWMMLDSPINRNYGLINFGCSVESQWVFLWGFFTDVESFGGHICLSG